MFTICRLAEGFYQGSDQNTVVYFPCAFSHDVKTHTDITIWGENHKSLLDMNRTRQLQRAGVRGDIYVGMEGMVYGDPANEKYWEYSYDADEESRLFGYEDGFSYSLTIALVNYMKLYRGANNLHGEKSFLSRRKVDFFVSFNESYIQEAWRQIDRPFPEPEDEELARIVDRIVSNGDIPQMSTREYIDFLNKEVTEIVSQKGKDEAFVRLSRVLATRVVALAREKYSRKENLPDMSSYYDLIRNPGSVEKEKKFMNEIAVKWRNFKMAENLAKIYCLALDEKKDFVVVVGGLHVQGLVEILRRSSNGLVGVFWANSKSLNEW